MSDIEKEVPSLELCRKLKELGYPQQGGVWYWVSFGKRYSLTSYTEIELDGNEYPWGIHTPSGLSESFDYIKAPTCQELGEWLPKNKNWNIYEDGYFGIVTYELENRRWEASTEANARAKMVVWLKENGYIDFWGKR